MAKAAAKTTKKTPVKRPAKQTAVVKVTEATPPAPVITPYHQWTHDGNKVRILKCVGPDRKAHGGFVWPDSGEVKPDTWKPDNACGNGLHGWAWGLAFGDGMNPSYQSCLWIVFEAIPTDVVQVEGGKVKAKQGTVIYCGKMSVAFEMIRPGQMAWAFHASSGAASNSGSSGAASNSGSSGAASNSGSSGAASNSGYRGAASNSGYRGAASNSGYRGAASNSGDRGIAASTGEESTLESIASGLCATTASDVFWRVRKGAVLCQRTDKGAWLMLADDLPGIVDGDVVRVQHGQWTKA